tara:strand:+ start:3882 stop:6296 length:2415 start_codon:yes stop_codon:yes gene_type:complete
MSYNIAKTKFERKEVVFVDLLLDQNNLNIGFAASDPTSYNTPKTTGSTSAFLIDNPKKAYRFSSGFLGKESGMTKITPYLPILDSISFSSSTLDPGLKAAVSASVSIKFNDIITTDVYELPSSSDPAFDYSNRRVTGSFWSKLSSRNFIQNRVIKVYRGFQDPNEEFDINNFESEYYVVEAISRGKDGSASIKGVDPLFYTKESKAKVPIKTNGVTVQSIDSVSNSIIVDVTTGNPEEYDTVLGVQNAVLIGEELFDYIVISTTSNSAKLSLDRLGFPGETTTNQEHDAGSKVQKCFSVPFKQNVVNIIRTLLTQYTKISIDLIDNDGWIDQFFTTLAPYNFQTVITKPEPVSKIINELIEHSGASLFWDTVEQKLKLFGVSEFSDPQFFFDDDNIKQNSLSINVKSKDQITRQTINFDKVNYIKSSTNEDDFKQGFIFIDGNAEDESAYDITIDGKVIYSRWLDSTTNDISIATSIVSRNVLRRSNAPTTFKFVVDPSSVGVIGDKRAWLGNVISIKSRIFTGANNEAIETLAQITKIQKRKDGYFDIEALNFQGNVSTVDFTLSENRRDFVLTDEFTPIAGRVNTLLIEQSSTIDSSGPAIAALNTGVWPDGLTIINRGKILASGGKGASAGQSFVPEEDPACFGGIGVENGGTGGTAIISQCNLEIDNGSGGLIFGGGGGGGASSPYVQLYGSAAAGNGGSGGQGSVGGIAGLGSIPAPQETSPIGQDGEDGDIDGPGLIGGDGGFFGEYGQDVYTALCGFQFNQFLSEGGTPGYSINKNGFNVSVVSGNNAQQLKGPILP